MVEEWEHVLLRNSNNKKQQNAKTICTQNAGGSTQFWQCQYFGCIWSPSPSLIDFVAKRKPQLNKNNLWNRASLPVGCWWKAKKGGWLCTLEHQLAPTSWNLAGHTLQGEEENREKEKQEERRKGELSYQVLQFNGEKQSALVSLDLHKELKT